MSTNELLPFALGDTPNMIGFDEWKALPARLTGFQSGIASSAQFNRIFAQGGLAGYLFGQFIVEMTKKDAKLNADELYAHFLEALASWGWAQDNTLSGGKLLDGSLVEAKIKDDTISASKLAANAVETEKIKDAAVTLAKMAANSVDNSKIKDATIAFAKFAAAAVATSAQAADKSNAETIVTPARMHEVINLYLMPAGTIVSYAGASVPSGWLLCNGANVSRTTYANLFNAIGTRWGAGNGSTTFTLPDSDGRVLQGATDVSKVGKYLEAGLPNIIGTLKVGNLPSYQNMYQIQGDGAFSNNTKNGYFERIANGSNATGSGSVNMNASNSSSVFKDLNTVQPAALQTLIIIKA